MSPAGPGWPADGHIAGLGLGRLDAVTPSKIAARLALGAAVAVAALVGTTGCSLIAPQATLIRYDPAEGVGADLGQVSIRSAEAVANPDSGAISVVFTAINPTSDTVTVNVSLGKSGADGKKSVSIRPGKSVQVGTDSKIVVDDPTDAPVGSLYPVAFQAGDADSVQVGIPVLTDSGRPFLTPFVP